MNPHPIPTLPLVNGAFLIDNSTLEKLKCPRLYQLEPLNKRVLADAKAGRNFGSTLHRGWEVRSKLCGNKAVNSDYVPLINNAMLEWLNDNPQPLEDFRNFNHACEVMRVYNNYYKDEPYKILINPKTLDPLVECSFALPLGTVWNTPVLWCGKLDLLTEWDTGVWAGPDHKTTFQFGENWEKSMMTDSGQCGYTWAARQVLGPSVKVNGYIIDGVRIRAPRKKDLYDEDKPPVDKTDFKRIPYYVSDDDIEEWKEDTLALIADIFHHHSRSFFPRSRPHCVGKFGPCDMFNICTLPRARRHDALMGTAYEDNHWSPLKQVEEATHH